MLASLYGADGFQLHRVVAGQSGSGKTYFVENTAKAYLKTNNDPSYRMVYFSPKNEGFTDLLGKKQKPVHNVDDMVKQLVDNKVVVFYPDSTGLSDTMDDTIEALFDIKDNNEDFKVCLIIDDCQVFLSSRRAASDAFNRMALLGRSRNINAIYMSHAVVLNKSLEGQVDSLYLFTLPSKLHHKATEERFGFNPAPYMDSLKERPYSFLRVDIRKGSHQLMNPLGE